MKEAKTDEESEFENSESFSKNFQIEKSLFVKFDQDEIFTSKKTTCSMDNASDEKNNKKTLETPRVLDLLKANSQVGNSFFLNTNM